METTSRAEIGDQELLDALHTFVDREIMPIQKEIQPLFDNPRLHYLEDGRESPKVTEARQRARMAAAEAGFYTMFCPKEFGGQDLGVRLWFLCWESLFHRFGPPATQLPYFVLSHFTSGPHEVWEHASEALRAKMMPDLTSGRVQGCFALTEPDAGSDNWMMKTHAVRDGDDWIINGTKQWITWSPTADFVMVYAVTNRELATQRKGGITCFFVPTDTPGYQLISVLKVWGSIGGDEGLLGFTDVRVPDAYRVGEVDRGFDLAMLGVRHGRLANAGRTLGQARWCLEKAIDYAKVRRTFGKTLSEHDTIRTYLAESAMELYAARMMALDAAAKCDTDRDVRGEVSMLKVFATRTAFSVINRCIQVLGGMGIANETHMIEALFQARTTWIVEGTNEIQLRTVARSLLEGKFDLSFK
jgi:acyl-CoA dehydrogenase